MSAGPIAITWLATSPVESKRAPIGKMWEAQGLWPVTSGVSRDAYFFDPAFYSNLDVFLEDIQYRLPGGTWTMAAWAPNPELKLQTEMHARDGANFCDVATRFLILDFDGLTPDANEDLSAPAAFGDGKVVNVMCARLRKAGVQALASTRIVVLATASTGFPVNAKGKPAAGCARFRALFETDVPITWAQQKVIAEAIGDLPGFGSLDPRAKSCVDRNIYSGGHNIFIARPILPKGKTDPIAEPAAIYAADAGAPNEVDVAALKRQLKLGPDFDTPPKTAPKHDNDGRSRALPVAPELRLPLIQQALKAIANRDFDRDRWVHMAHAIEGALDGHPAAEMLFLRFSKRRLDGPSDLSEDWRVWETRGEGRAGYGFIMRQLESQGTAEARAAIAAIRAAQTDFKPLAGGGVILINAATLRPEPVEWLWKDWLQARALNLLAGQSTAGKSTIALDFSAQITTGGRWPDGSPAVQGHVVFWSGEDVIENTLLPRFLAAGGDPRFMHFIGGLEQGGRKRPFDPARDMPELMRAVRELDNVRMAVLDPVAVVVTGDSHKNTESRVGLQPFADLCMHTRAGGLGVHHFTKNTSGGHPLDRVSGSLAFHALPRCVLAAARDQNGGSNGRRVLLRAKISNGPDGDGFEYGVEQVSLADYPEIVAQRTAWGGPALGTAREILAEFEPQKAKKAMKALEAIQFLEAELKDGPRAAGTISAAAIRAGVSEWALKQARQALGVASRKGGFEEGWMWTLPEVAF